MPACFSYPAPHPADSPAAPAPAPTIRCRAARTARAPSGPPGCSPHPDARACGAVAFARPGSNAPAFRRNDASAAPIFPRRFCCRSALGAGAGL
ncbi:hypothetical protein [Streptomyces syringium]|uniref:hypothetical protein n=1 Tax=Streptomyces syringium TaxID=76729 RepID=UPI003AB0153C